MSPFMERLAIRVRFVPRTYFAPLTGAIRGIREEYARIERDEQTALAEWDRKYENSASSDTSSAT